jgi:hypothetical protein
VLKAEAEGWSVLTSLLRRRAESEALYGISSGGIPIHFS